MVIYVSLSISKLIKRNSNSISSRTKLRRGKKNKSVPSTCFFHAELPPIVPRLSGHPVRLYLYICTCKLASVSWATQKEIVVEQFPQLLPLPHKRFLSSVDVNVRRFWSLVSIVFAIFSSLLLSFYCSCSCYSFRFIAEAR